MGRVSQRQNGEKMRLGVKQVLTVVKLVDFGVYLGSDEERVLLPKKQVPDGIELGDPIEVFLYKDSSDRMIATTNEPKITLGQLAVLTVADVGRMGAFLDWGLETLSLVILSQVLAWQYVSLATSLQRRFAFFPYPDFEAIQPVHRSYLPRTY